MALGILKPAAAPGALGQMMRRGNPGHFVALTEDGRIDATINNAKFADALEKRMSMAVSNTMEGPADGSRPPVASPGFKSVDPYDLTIVMAAPDGVAPINEADREAWSKFRLTYDAVMEATPFRITGVLLLLPSIDPSMLMERGTELFLPVFQPIIQMGAVPVRDVPRDVVLVNRSHLRRVNANLRR